MRKRIFLGVLLVAAMLVPVGANAADPVLTGGELGPEWKAYELTSDGTPVSLVFKLKVHREPQTVGRWVFNPDGTFRNGFQFRAIPIRSKLETHIEVSDGVEYDVNQQGDEYDWDVTIGPTSAMLPGTPANPKTYIVLLFTGGVASTPPTWTLTLPEDKVVLGDQTSGETYYLMPDDFDAPVKVSAEHAVHADPIVFPFGMGPGAHAVVGGRKVIDVEGVFLGEWHNTNPYYQASSSAYRSTVTDESGFERDCTIRCPWVHYWVPPEWSAGVPVGLPAGRYTFEHTGGGAGAAEYSYLFGMDVTLPE